MSEPLLITARDNNDYSPDKDLLDEGATLYEKSGDESLLFSLLRRLDRGNLGEIKGCQQRLLAHFSIEIIKEAAEQLVSHKVVCSNFVKIVDLPQFQSELESQCLESQLILLSFVARHSRNPVSRSSSICEGMRLIRQEYKKVVLNNFARGVQLRTCEHVILSFLISIHQGDSQAALEVFQMLLDCSIYGPGELSRTKAADGLKQIARLKGLTTLIEEANSEDDQLRFQAIHLMGFLKSMKALQILLRLYAARILEREQLQDIILKHYSCSYRTMANRLSSKDQWLCVELESLIDIGAF